MAGDFDTDTETGVEPIEHEGTSVLSTAECRRLLRAAHSGRVAWTAPDGPQVLPVSTLYRNGNIVFRTSPHGPLSALRHRTYVAFEIDSIDRAEAWSVVVRGVATEIHAQYDLIELWEDEGLVPWAGGKRPLFIEIQPQTISGRRYRRPAD
ncbi:pyridoxamine 5'-phosphate oxidase family protein [Microlunatus ginsengisoli]|uniref:Pyridoxamine 5'-phosphate oxidase family protein n=1 Tax=Microlunatus ginsengisoli TaxID=363863 RepID=A0ABP7AHI0_9ACTN